MKLLTASQRAARGTKGCVKLPPDPEGLNHAYSVNT